MVLNRTRWVSVVVIACFAILQALQPFIHAHLDVEHPIQNIGFHVGNDHEETLGLDEVSHSVSAHHPSYTISVASGIKQDINPILVNSPPVAIVLSFCFLIALQPTRQYNFSAPHALKAPPKRRLHAPRAPPQF